MSAILQSGLFEPTEKPKPAPVIERPYQKAARESWLGFLDSGKRRGLIVMATGTGKTFLFNSIIRSMSEQNTAFTCLALAHRHELLSQIVETAQWINPDHRSSIHSGDFKAEPGSSIVAASVQSLGRPGSNALSWLSPSLVICDEAHHAAADTYQNVFRRFECYEPYGTPLLGLTATPHRLDNKALVGDSERAIFEGIAFRYDIVAAIRDGFLVDLKGYRAAAEVDLSKVKVSRGDYQQNQLEDAMNVDHVNQLAFESWEKAGCNHQTIVFCSGVDHAKAVAEVFNAKGVPSAAVWGDMSKDDRKKAIEDFRSGKIKVLTNMDILTEGFDARQAGCVILLRPTKSWSLFVQMIGRGLRTLPNVIEGLEHQPSIERRNAIQVSSKPECIVIDIVGIAGEDGHNASEKKTGEGTPSLNALVGLPEGLDIEGHSVIEALNIFHELPEVLQASAAGRRNLRFNDLTAELSQVQMLSEIDSPQEAIDFGEFFWLKPEPNLYVLNCGNIGTVKRRAQIIGDMLGNWTLELSSDHRNPQLYELPSDLELAFPAAESIIQNQFPGVKNLVGRKSAWMAQPITELQINALKKEGVPDYLFQHLNRGKASAMIETIRTRKVLQGGIR